MHIHDFRLFERFRESIFVELRIVSRTRNGPNIHNLFDFVSFENVDEGLNCPCRMADCIDNWLFNGSFSQIKLCSNKISKHFSFLSNRSHSCEVLCPSMLFWPDLQTHKTVRLKFYKTNDAELT